MCIRDSRHPAFSLIINASLSVTPENPSHRRGHFGTHHRATANVTERSYKFLTIHASHRPITKLSQHRRRESIEFEIVLSEGTRRSTMSRINRNSVSRATVSLAMGLALAVGSI